mgnify:CR=1 FL=1|tara:strand:- start:1462 stop:1818 length:357 start_codon:yes stop_codon:yes gene_type:complete
MPVTTTKNGVAIIDQLMFDTDVDQTENADVFGGSATIYSLRIDNSGALAWVKFYDAAAATVGTTSPDYIFQADASETVIWTIVDGFAMNNLTLAATDSAGTAGTTTPAGTVKVHAVAR